VHAFKKILHSFAVSLLFVPLAALAARPITGTVTNGTTHKPSAGDTVTLIRLEQSMVDSTHTTTDARGHYRLEVPDDGVHLVRVTHDKANYFQPATPGTSTVDMTVYDAAAKVEGVVTNVEEFHVSATASELQVVEVLEVLNQSSPERTQFGPGGFDFYLPANAHLVRTGAVTEGGKLPVPATAVPLDKAGHYTFLFPIRPGETQFGVMFTMPYTGTFDWQPRLATPVNTLAVMLPAGMSFGPKPGSPFSRQQADAPGTQTFAAQNVMPGQDLSFTLAGTGSLPEPSSDSQGQQAGAAGSGNGPDAATEDTAPGKGLGNPLDPNGTREPLATKYKWWILGGLGLVLVVAAGILLRKPAVAPMVGGGAASSLPLVAGPPAGRQEQLLQVLKEELFALETDRLQGQIDEADYGQQKAAIELILRRALRRGAAATGSTV
jgi:hypothetical protein